MYLTELCNFKENLLKTVLLIIINLSDCYSGSTSHITIADTDQISDVVKNLGHSSVSDFTNIPSLQIASPQWPTLKQQYSNNVNFLDRNHSLTGDQENEKDANIVMSKNTKNHPSNLRVTHSFVELANKNLRINMEQNTSKHELVFSTPMFFGTANSTVIVTQIGATARIPCLVHHLGECVVSWIRKKDYHLLTVGLTTYSSDQRFSAIHLKHSEDWTLQIKFVQQRDAGTYECQVSTHPPTSIFLDLVVIEARAEISGPSIRYLTPGSTLRLQCHVIQNTENTEYIFWYHDNRMINYDADRGINVSTEPDFQSSELTISRTHREHSGNYTCVASNTQPASVLIHIFKGDNPAAMYHGHVGSAIKSYEIHLLHILIVLIAMIYVKRKII